MKTLTEFYPRSFHWSFLTTWRSNPKIKNTLFIGSNQCLGGETLIYDPILNKERRVDEITGNHHVLAWNGVELTVAEAFPPFQKDPEGIYKITLDNGDWFTCSQGHLTLTQTGYQHVGELSVGDSLFRPSSILDTTSQLMSQMICV